MSNQLTLLIGTKKGLFLLTSSDRQRWDLQGSFLGGKEINHAIIDRRTRRLFATANDAWFGSEIVWSDDFGRTWQALTNGLPQTNAFMGIYRQAMSNDTQTAAGIYFGSNTGKLFGSTNDGNWWKLVADNLPPIYSVETAVGQGERLSFGEDEAKRQMDADARR